MKTRFSLKSVMLATLVATVAVWALRPTAADLLAVRNAQAKNVAIRNALIQQGHKPQIDWQLGRKLWRRP